MRRPALTAKVLEGLSLAVGEAETVLQADAGNSSEIYDAKDHDELAAADRWVRAMFQWRRERAERAK